MEKENLTFKKGIKDGLPIGLGYFPVAFAFGVKASLLSVPVLISVLISMTNVTSAGQLAGLNVIATLGSFLEIIILQLVINLRYGLMSITLSQKVDGSFNLRNRLLCSAFITDEIFAVASSKKSLINNKYFYGLALLPYIGWALGTVVGALAGNILPADVSACLNIALYAMFIAIIIPPSMENKGVLITILFSTAVSCALYYIPLFSFLSEGFKIIISAILSACVIAFIFPVKQENDEGESV